MKKKTQEQAVLSQVERLGIMRPRDLASLKIPRTVLGRMVSKGRLLKLSRGLYSLPETGTITEHHGFAEACKRVPLGVICLLSSLVFHNMTTQMPSQIWMAIPGRSRLPKPSLPVRFVFFSGEALKQGIKDYVVEGVKVRVYNPAKTIVDCFRYRNKIGRDVAIEAMRDALGKKLCSFSEIWHYAQMCRVTKIIMPYMEAMS